MSEKVEEVRLIPELKVGEQIFIRRGDYAGWSVCIGPYRDSCVMAGTAHFSQSSELLEWLDAVLKRSAALSPQ